ncbi:membrane protein containing NADH:ubiquinone/plastoquinone oxidoreductase domain protein, partial [mine drainage metagenome]
MMFQALPLLSVVPLVAAGLLILAMHRDQASKYIAMAGSLISLLVIAVVVLYYVGGAYSVGWFSVAGYTFHITTTVMPLNALLLALVGIVTPLIFWYSFGYMDTRSEQSRYYFEMSLFAAAMMLFAISGNFITIFIAWEMLGITSYLLIGFWYAKKVVPDAARKAISTILIGDILFLAAIIVLWSAYHTLNIQALLSITGSSLYLKVALAFILVAAFTK